MKGQTCNQPMSLKALQTEHLAVQMSIERRVRGLVGLMSECVSQATPPSQKCLCVLPWQQLVCWRKLMSLWMCFWGEGRWMGWWRESRNGRDIFFVPQEMKQAVNTLWLAKHWWTHSHTHLHTHSHKTAACFSLVSPNQHPSFFLYLPSHLCCAIYFCLYCISSPLITVTIGY